MSTPTTQLVRPAGAGHETLYVLLLCPAILAAAGSVVLWRGEPEVVSSVQTHQLDARRDLGASEQGIYADLRVTLDEIHLLVRRAASPADPANPGRRRFCPLRPGRQLRQPRRPRLAAAGQWRVLRAEPPAPSVAGSFLMRLNALGNAEPDIWLNRGASLQAPADLADAALISAGWQQVVAQFDAGVTRQHRH